jgi:hypothetical protein
MPTSLEATSSGADEEFPPVQHPNSFTIDDAMKQMAAATSGD